MFCLKNKKAGFTLVECLASLLFAAVLIGCFLSAFSSAVKEYRFFKDRRVAYARIWTANGIIRSPACYGAHAMECASDEYKKLFQNQSRAPFSWNGPVEVTQDANGRAAGLLRLAYAFPSGRLVKEPRSVTKSPTTVPFVEAVSDNFFNLAFYDKKQSVKNWVFFENAAPRRAPLAVTYQRGHDVKLKSFDDEPIEIPRYDTLLLFRVLEIYVSDGKLVTKDYNTAGAQPREEGVCDVRFSLNKEKSLLTVYMIVRGDDATLSPGKIINAGKVPQEMLAPWRGSDYILYCARFVWPLSNYETQ